MNMRDALAKMFAGARKRFVRALVKVGNVAERPFLDLYENWLLLQVKEGPLPRHIAIIPDGNRRWARMLGEEPWIGHLYGYEKIKETLQWIWELGGVKYVTIYAMSTENCRSRSQEERAKLFELFERGVRELIESGELERRRVRVKVIGDRSLIPPRLLELSKKIEDLTASFNERYLYIALCYGGRHEILEAVKRIYEDLRSGKIRLEDLDEELFSSYLFTGEAPDPDLVIRTSGEERISNFLLWQAAYSELYFCDVLWPDFRKVDFLRAIRSYQMRERRFGK